MKSHHSVITQVSGSDNVVWSVGSLTRVLANSDQTAGTFGIVEDFAPAGSDPPMHKHDDDEAFYVLAGKLTYFIEGNTPIKARPGWFLHVPGGTIHGFRVDSGTARYLIITTPHHANCYLAMADPAESNELPPTGEADYTRIGAASEQFGVEYVGEWPD